MTKYIYCFKNVKSGQFGNPVLEVITKDNAVEAYSVAAKEAPEQEKVRMAELDLYYLGTFDTKSGKVDVIDPEYLMSVKEVLGDGTKEQDN